MTNFVDFNILNRASFDNRPITIDLRVAPTVYEGSRAKTLGESVYWVRSVDWKFGYFDVGMFGSKEIPLQKLKITIGGGVEKPLLELAEDPLRNLSPPIPITGRIDCAVQNTNIGNNHELRIKFVLHGVLVTPKPGQDPLTLKQMLGYIMMDDAKRGELAFAEAVVDSLDEKMVDMGMDSLRSSLPHGLGAIKALPEPLQKIFLQNANPALLGLDSGNPQDPAAPIHALTLKEHLEHLPLVDSEKEKSTFLGDLLTACSDLTPEQLKAISDEMVDKGWRRF
jgi:hypothetical protein